MIPSGSDIKLALSTLSDLVKKGMTIEAQEKIMDLREMVVDLRDQCVDLREENTLLKAKLAEKGSVFFEGGVYWIRKGDGSKDGPFCSPCYDNNGKLIRLTKDRLFYQCPVQSCNFGHQHTKDSPGGRGPAGEPNSWMAR